jgi:hypothetical protein
MHAPSRFLLLTAALAVSATVLASSPASAQQPSPSIRDSVANANVTAPSDTAFLVAGMAPSAAAEAQQSSGGGRARAEGFGFGIKGGFLFNSFTQANNTALKGKTGNAFGIFFGGNRGGTVGVMGELLYASKTSETGAQDTKLHYLEIPILLRLNFGSPSRNGVSVYGLVGPVFDINLSASLNGLDVKSKYQSLDLGAIVGAGVEVTRFIIEGRYNWGLRNIQNGNLATLGDIKTKTFALLIGLRLN